MRIVRQAKRTRHSVNPQTQCVNGLPVTAGEPSANRFIRPDGVLAQRQGGFDGRDFRRLNLFSKELQTDGAVLAKAPLLFVEPNPCPGLYEDFLLMVGGGKQPEAPMNGSKSAGRLMDSPLAQEEASFDPPQRVDHHRPFFEGLSHPCTLRWMSDQVEPADLPLADRPRYVTRQPASMNNSIRFKLFLMMILEISIWGAWQVQIFNYMPMLGFEQWQQNLAGSMFAIASVVGIFFSNQFADRNFSAERFLAFSHLIGGLALVGTAFAHDFTMFFSCFLAYGLLYVPTISVTNAVAFANLKDPARDFGFVRMGGTVGWIVVSWPLIFLLDAQSTVQQMRWIFLVAAIISFALSAFSLTLPHTPPKKAGEGAAEALAWLEAIKLLRHPYVLVLFIVTLIDSTIHNGYFVLIGGFLKTPIQMPDNWISAITTIGQVAEIVTMLILGSVLKKIGWKWTMILGIMGHAMRFAVFSFFAAPEYKAVIIAVQVLHGICYAFFFATLYIFVDEVFPKDIRTSAQGLFNLLVLGAGLVLANFWFGSLKAHWTVNNVVDYHKLFLVPTGLAVLSMLLLLLFFRPPSARPLEAQSSGAAPH